MQRAEGTAELEARQRRNDDPGDNRDSDRPRDSRCRRGASKDEDCGKRERDILEDEDDDRGSGVPARNRLPRHREQEQDEPYEHRECHDSQDGEGAYDAAAREAPAAERIADLVQPRCRGEECPGQADDDSRAESGTDAEILGNLSGANGVKEHIDDHEDGVRRIQCSTEGGGSARGEPRPECTGSREDGDGDRQDRKDRDQQHIDPRRGCRGERVTQEPVG